MLKTQPPFAPRYQADMAAPISIGTASLANLKETFIRIARALRLLWLRFVRMLRWAIKAMTYSAYDQAMPQDCLNETLTQLRERHYRNSAFYPHLYI